MSKLDAAIKTATAMANGQSQQERLFMPGEAGIPWGYIPFGVETSMYAPERYGDYIVKSNPFYAIATWRANLLASLPLKLYQIAETTTSINNPRSVEGQLKAMIEQLGKIQGKQRDRLQDLFVMNIIGALMHSQSSLELVAKQRKMGLAEVIDGPIFKLLRTVNPYWTPVRLWRMTSMALDIWGQAYWFIERGPTGKGTPREIWWAKPTQVRPVPHPENYIAGYWYVPVDGGQWLWYEPDEVIRIYNPNPNDQFQPLSPLSSAQIYADHENTSMQANMNLHKQGLSPGAVITPKDKHIWSEKQARAIEAEINNRMGGFERAHKWMVFRQEIQKYDTSVTPRDSEFVNGMQYDIDRVANALHWPVDLLGGKRTYENIDQALKQAWQTVVIQAAFIAAEVSEQLFPMFDNPGVDVAFFDHTNVAVLQESETTRWERERTQVNRVITVNEWRMERGLEPVEGGDQLFVSNQDTPIDSPVFVTDPAVQGVPPTQDQEPQRSLSKNGSRK